MSSEDEFLNIKTNLHSPTLSLHRPTKPLLTKEEFVAFKTKWKQNKGKTIKFVDGKYIIVKIDN